MNTIEETIRKNKQEMFENIIKEVGLDSFIDECISKGQSIEKVKESLPWQVSRFSNPELNQYIKTKYEDIIKQKYEAYQQEKAAAKNNPTFTDIPRTLNDLFGSMELLKHQEIEPLTYLADDFILSTGSFVIGGDPKAGKTYLAMQLAESVATGNKFLDTFDTDQGQVLYVMTQGGKRLLKNRLHLIENGTKKHDDMYYLTTLPPLESGGYDVLKQFIALANNPKLIVLDMLSSLVPAYDDRQYQKIMEVHEKLNNFALDNNICILSIWHNRKSTSDNSNIVENILGSRGITGGVSGILGLKITRQDRKAREKEAEVIIIPREGEEKEKQLIFRDSKWHYLGDSLPKRKTEREIFLTISKNEGLGNSEIADILDRDKSNNRKTLKRLVEEGYLTENEGRYYTNNS